MTDEPKDFKKWMIDVKSLLCSQRGFASEASESIDAEAWKEYFESGESPDSAIREEFNNG